MRVFLLLIFPCLVPSRLTDAAVTSKDDASIATASDALLRYMDGTTWRFHVLFFVLVPPVVQFALGVQLLACIALYLVSGTLHLVAQEVFAESSLPRHVSLPLWSVLWLLETQEKPHTPTLESSVCEVPAS